MEKQIETGRIKYHAIKALAIKAATYVFLIALLAISAALASPTRTRVSTPQEAQSAAAIETTEITILKEKVLPAAGVVLPVRWGDLGAQMVDAGVINREKFAALYANHSELDNEIAYFLSGDSNGPIVMTAKNSGVILNLLWALGLGTKNAILESGPMTTSRDGAGRFASTGGWTLANGDAMDHYSRHPFVVLTPEQQALVEHASKNIYRPCCDNPTYFPDCNHGMAMLGLLELMASQNLSEKEMYKTALRVNAYWFPDTYLTIGQYLASEDIEWDEINPKIILGAEYSSGSGYRNILSRVPKPVQGSGGSCRV